jgi:hypothetical protein
LICIALGALAGGCRSTSIQQPATYYTGPTLPLDQLLAAINQNNARINTVNASGTFLLSTPDEGELNGQITLLYTKPDKLRVFLDKDAIGRVSDLGTDGSQFWMVVKGKNSTTWHGKNFGPAESNPNVPIAPQLLADVLGVATLNLDLLAQPIPTMRFNPDYDCYMLTWHQPLRDRWVTLREIWYDRATLEPRRIWLFDRNGRVILRAKLGATEVMTVKDQSAAQPRMARNFELFFPETRAKFNFNLDSVRDERRGLPKDISYRFNPQAQDTDRIINLDQTAPLSGDSVDIGR